jgi:hypothetical protein
MRLFINEMEFGMRRAMGIVGQDILRRCVMMTINIQWRFRRLVSMVCAFLLFSGLMIAQENTPPEQPLDPVLSPGELDTLVAPVALYPDALLSQVLVAATYPLEIAQAGQWLQQNRNLQGSQLVEAARKQNWDPSIQALVVFPDVLSRLNADIRWTTNLGNAFLAQQADVMNAVQRLRAEAKATGKLRSNTQETVTVEKQGDQSVIVIQPANPEVVYVPYYNPEYIWGPPRYGYYPAWDYPYFGFGFGFGPGIYIGGFFGGLVWGGWGWGPNWYHCSIYQNHYFFNHYGYGGYGHGYGGYGYRGGSVWSHDPGHRMGVHYSNRALNQRYGGGSMAHGQSNGWRYGGQSYAARQYNSAPRSGMARTGGWQRFSQSGSTSQGGQHGYRSTSTYTGNNGYRQNPSAGRSDGGTHSMSGYRSNSSNGNGGGYPPLSSSSSSSGGARNVPTDRPSSSYGNSSGYRSLSSSGGSSGGGRTSSSPSYGNSSGYRSLSSSGGSYGGARNVPSYRSSPSYGGGNSGSHNTPAYRSSPSSGGGGFNSRGSYGGGSNHSAGGSQGGHGRR